METVGEIWEWTLTLLRVLALALTAMILVPSAAHLFELPGKIALDRDDYLTVQGMDLTRTGI